MAKGQAFPGGERIVVLADERQLLSVTGGGVGKQDVRQPVDGLAPVAASEPVGCGAPVHAHAPSKLARRHLEQVHARLYGGAPFLLLRHLRHTTQADAEPRGAGVGLSQALGPSAPSCPGRGCDRGIKKDFPARLAEVARRLGADTANIEIWFGDQARIGQKNKITRRWARRGSAPRRLTTSVRHPPTFSAQSAPRTARRRV